MYARSTIRRNLGYLRGRGDWTRYSELVTARHGQGRYTIYLRRNDRLGRLGAGPIGPKILASTAGMVGKAATFGLAAGPIGAGVGLVVGMIAGLWAAHDARVKGATAENQVVGSALQAFDQSLQAIFAAANSSDPSQNITAQQAVVQCQQLLAQFWSACEPYTSAPGAADASHGGANCSGLACDKSCTVTCCVGCADLGPSIANCMAVFQAGGGTAQILTVYKSKFGLSQRQGYSLTYTAPTIAGVAGGSPASASTALGSLASGGSGSLLVIGLIVIGGIALARR